MATSRLGPNSARQLALPQRLSIPNSKIPSHGGHGDRPVEFHTFPIRCVQTPLGTSIGIIGKDISWAKPMVAAGGSTAWITCTTRASSHLVPSWYIGDQDAKADAADAVAKPAKPCQSDFGSLASEFLHIFPSWQVRLGHGPILLHSGTFQQMWCPFLFFFAWCYLLIGFMRFAVRGAACKFSAPWSRTKHEGLLVPSCNRIHPALVDRQQGPPLSAHELNQLTLWGPCFDHPN